MLSHLKSRYIENDDGTVTDNRTGLIWLKDANCFNVMLEWKTAKEKTSKLAHGQCNLSDSSKIGEWRLPKKNEWKDMLDIRYTWPALSNTEGTSKWVENQPFTGVQSSWYWTSSTLDFAPSYAWYVILHNGSMRNTTKTLRRYVWPVRDQ